MGEFEIEGKIDSLQTAEVEDGGVQDDHRHLVWTLGGKCILTKAEVPEARPVRLLRRLLLCTEPTEDKVRARDHQYTQTTMVWVTVHTL